MTAQPVLLSEVVRADVVGTLAVGAPRADPRDAFDELVKFLRVASTTSERLVPSDAVDEVWHVLIAHPRYAEFCEAICGSAIGHDPGGAAGAPTGYARARELMTARFGAADERLWPARTTAGCTTDQPDPGDDKPD